MVPPLHLNVPVLDLFLRPSVRLSVRSFGRSYMLTTCIVNATIQKR